MSYEAYKVIDKEFEEMINEVCGETKLAIKKGRPTPEFYLPIYHEDFMKWWKKRDEEKYCPKTSVECNSCGEKFIIYTEPFKITTMTYNNDIGGSPAATSWHEQYQNVSQSSFYCYKCGHPFVVSGSKILKIKSKQLEVVL